VRSTRDTWRDTRFSRRLGEQVPDATYASAIECMRPGRIRNALAWLIGWSLIAGALSLPYWWNT
jgi:hypothetical protein